MSKAFHVFLLCSVLSLPILGSSNAHAATFVAVGTGACLTDQFGNTANGNPTQALQCFGTFSQQWLWVGFAIQGIGTTAVGGKCVDVQGGGTADGTPVQLFDCNGTGAQQWNYNNGQIINVRSRKCLDIGDATNGTRATIRTCNFNGGTFQVWAIRN
ncbi:MAG: RICIN domain-containing protein [Pseudomonadota bacterium]|nr:RICIN domain-containing protein [Pseudomonadota bacterium]